MEKGSVIIVGIILAIFFIVFLLVGIYLILKANNPNLDEDIKEKGLIDAIFGYEEDGSDPALQETEESTSSTGSSGSSGGGGGGGGGSTSSTSEGGELCFTDVSYSMKEHTKLSNCNQYDGEICIDKTVTCSIEVYNRDTTIGGNFRVELLFVEDKKGLEEALDSESFYFYLNPNSMNKIKGDTNIVSTGENGTANQIINCFFNTYEVPLRGC
ncbi:MAG: hypothetical protein ABIB79_00135 [archaeon]